MQVHTGSLDENFGEDELGGEVIYDEFYGD